MTVAELIEYAKKLPPDAPVLLPGSDHSYYLGHAEVTTANVWGTRRKNYSEDFGDDHRQPEETSVPALVIR